jgi:hypothetical protein
MDRGSLGKEDLWNTVIIEGDLSKFSFIMPGIAKISKGQSLNIENINIYTI